MATLEEGYQYGLSSNFSSFSNKSVVHVKLTDTFLKVIEDFVKKKVKAVCFVRNRFYDQIELVWCQLFLLTLHFFGRAKHNVI